MRYIWIFRSYDGAMYFRSLKRARSYVENLFPKGEWYLDDDNVMWYRNGEGMREDLPLYQEVVQ